MIEVSKQIQGRWVVIPSAQDEKGIYSFTVGSDGNFSMSIGDNPLAFKETEWSKNAEGMTWLNIDGKDTNVRLLGAYKDGNITLLFIEMDGKVMAGYISGKYESPRDEFGHVRKTPIFTPFEEGTNQITIGGKTYTVEWTAPKKP
ncbi:MAG: hypothetical protein QXG02_03595 [Candidatus Anstonellales archaeon]